MSQESSWSLPIILIGREDLTITNASSCWQVDQYLHWVVLVVKGTRWNHCAMVESSHYYCSGKKQWSMHWRRWETPLLERSHNYQKWLIKSKWKKHIIESQRLDLDYCIKYVLLHLTWLKNVILVWYGNHCQNIWRDIIIR